MGALCCRESSIDFDEEVDLTHFNLLRSVGRGAFSKVRIVQHKRSRQLYALKYINKTRCIQMKAVDNILTERHILQEVRHTFIVNMYYAFQDEEHLFMVLDLKLGGDLRFHLDRLGRFSEASVKLYVAEISLALDYLHGKDIVHRDLKPDNILLDSNGHMHLTDFNVAVKAAEPIFNIGGSLAYIAPEMLGGKGYRTSVDWWSLGVVSYELMFGKRPFRGKSNDALQHAILHRPISFDSGRDPVVAISAEAQDFILRLLARNVGRRLIDIEAIRAHPWFSDTDFDLVLKRAITPPFKPDDKRTNFDPTHELEEMLIETNPLKARKRTKFQSTTTKHSVTSNTNFRPEQLKLEQEFAVFDFSRVPSNTHTPTTTAAAVKEKGSGPSTAAAVPA